MSVTIYHNPRCTKSRQTLQLLESKGFHAEVVEYLKTPLDENALRALLKMLAMTPRQLIRTKEEEYKALNLDRPDVSDDALIHAMVQHPKLMERPIVCVGGKAVIGRPPENVLSIL